MAAKSGGKLLHFVGDIGQIFTEKSPEMVFLFAVGNRICAVMLSGAAGDQDQSDPGASVDSRDGDNLCTVDCREQCRIS